MSKRLARLNEQLKRELATLVRSDVRDPRVGVVTITAVETAADLGSARVYVRVVGGPKELETSLEGLSAAAPFLRSTLGRILRIRKVPELRFREDRSLDHARRIEQLLSEVMPDDEHGTAEPDDDAPADDPNGASVEDPDGGQQR